jgi:hypothetical protein
MLSYDEEIVEGCGFLLYSFIVMIKRAIIFLLLMLGIFSSQISAAVKMKARLEDDRGKDYDFIFTLTRKEENRLDFKLEKILKSYEIKARKEIAEQKGYVEEVYGEENYKLIQTSNFEYVVYDDRFDRILHTNVRIDDVDDF